LDERHIFVPRLSKPKQMLKMDISFHRLDLSKTVAKDKQNLPSDVEKEDTWWR